MKSVHTRIKQLASADAPCLPALFLDRDGVIVEEVGYLHRVEDVRFDAMGDLAITDDPFRKPNSGMIHAAAASLGLDLSASWMVGDKLVDVESACRGGIRGAIHVLSGYGKDQRVRVREWVAANQNPSFRVEYADTLAHAVAKYPDWLTN